MNGSIIVICLLDKAWPPQHSFVDGMLAGDLARDSDVRVRLCVSRRERSDSKPRRYGGAVCLPALYARRGGARFLNLWQAFKILRYQVEREQRRGNRIVFFVRNEPIYLLVATLLRTRVSRLVFQSSFPHEESSVIWVKRLVAKMMYHAAARGVDAVTAVSPDGLQRTFRLFPEAQAGCYVPLLSDLSKFERVHGYSCSSVAVPVFIYTGTHVRSRRLDRVLEAIVAAIRAGVVARFVFIGGVQKDRNRLAKIKGVRELLEQNIVIIDPPVGRDQIPFILSKADVGISLAPPTKTNREMSPTKLSEYMGAGLAVLATRGIPLQERFVSEAGCGLLVDWDVKSIAEAIHQMASNPTMLARYGENAETYAKEELQYSSYLRAFRMVLGLNEEKLEKRNDE
jgi:glycosyltransferase involved in cell wall biosynthesis